MARPLKRIPPPSEPSDRPADPVWDEVLARRRAGRPARALEALALLAESDPASAGHAEFSRLRGLIHTPRRSRPTRRARDARVRAQCGHRGKTGSRRPARARARAPPRRGSRRAACRPRANARPPARGRARTRAAGCPRCLPSPRQQVSRARAGNPPPGPPVGSRPACAAWRGFRRGDRGARRSARARRAARRTMAR